MDAVDRKESDDTDSDDELMMSHVELRSVDPSSVSAFAEVIKPENRHLVDAFLMKKYADERLVEAVMKATHHRDARRAPGMTPCECPQLRVRLCRASPLL